MGFDRRPQTLSEEGGRLAAAYLHSLRMGFWTTVSGKGFGEVICRDEPLGHGASYGITMTRKCSGILLLFMMHGCHRRGLFICYERHAHN